jgi:hypothetical protein
MPASMCIFRLHDERVLSVQCGLSTIRKPAVSGVKRTGVTMAPKSDEMATRAAPVAAATAVGAGVEELVGRLLREHVLSSRRRLQTALDADQPLPTPAPVRGGQQS